MTDCVPTPREAAARVALWLDQWRPDRHQTYALARADLQVLINHARATTAAGDDRGGELADAVWTLDDDGILGAIETSVSPGVARAVRTLLRAPAAQAQTIDRLASRLTQACAVLEEIEGVLAERGHRTGAPGDHANAVRDALASAPAPEDEGETAGGER